MDTTTIAFSSGSCPSVSASIGLPKNIQGSLKNGVYGRQFFFENTISTLLLSDPGGFRADSVKKTRQRGKFMKITTLGLGPLQTNAYRLDVAPDRFLLVDAPHGAWAEVKRAQQNGAICGAVLLTHGHWDHLVDLHHFCAADIPVIAHPADREWIEDPARMAQFLPFYLDLKPAKVTRWVEHGECFEDSGHRFEILHVPGHAPGNIAFYHAGEKAVFAGDALFQGSIGRYDLPGADGRQLVTAIREVLYGLPPETVVYPGHGPTTTIGEEMRSNPFVQADS